MNEERMYVTALPRSVLPDADVHVSAFLMPKLTPDAANPAPVVGDFAVTRRWAQAVAAGEVTFQLHDQSGALDATVDVGVVDPTLWDAVFPPDLPVRPNTVPDWTGREHRSFSVASAAAAVKAVNWITMLASPGDLPDPLTHPFAPFFDRLIDQFQLPDGRDRRPSARRFDEVGFRTALDRLLGSDIRRPGVSFVGTQASAVDQVAGFAVLAVRAARRFYDRPESQTVTSGSPVPSEQPPERVQPRGPEFHERAASAGDHPELLRRLGLLVDLRVDAAGPAVDRLRNAQWIAVTCSGEHGIARCVRTAVGRTRDGALVAAGAPAGSDSVAGVVPLGDPARFTVIDLDADGSALKLDRLLGNFPRLIALSRNGDDVTAATPAVRAQGLAVARTARSTRAHDRLAAQRTLEATLASATGPAAAPLVHADDITRGIRIEVWDASTLRWRSLHERRTTLAVTGFGEVYRDLHNEGFLQGTPAQETPGVADSPVYVHETVFGWEGWSLSAPRPGKRLRPVDVADPQSPTGWRQDEVAENTPADPAPQEQPPDPFRFYHDVAPATLPRLRYGREYAFRAWTVDLGGHSRAHALNPPPLPAAVIDTLRQQPGWTQLARRQAEFASNGGAAVTADTALARDVLPAAQTAVAAAADRIQTVRRVDLGALEGTTQGALEDTTLGASLGTDIRSFTTHIARRRGIDVLESPTAHSGVAQPVTDLAQGAIRGLWATVTARREPPVLTMVSADAAALMQPVAATIAALGGIGRRPVDSDAVAEAQNAVTALQPFLRWDPVPPPVVVPRRRYTEGESLRTIVVRSGVRWQDGSDAPVMTDPAAYAQVLRQLSGQPDADEQNVGYHEAGERHLVPPKTTLDHAELHDEFDRAIDAVGAERTTARSLVLGWALKDEGTLYDAFVVNPADPFGPRIPQSVALLHDPGAENGPLKTLPLAPGEGPASGQYLAVTSEQLTVPYLPDPLAEGISLWFPDAGDRRRLWLGYPREGFTVRYGGDWPERVPFLLRLVGGDALSASVAGHIVQVAVPAGESLRARLSSSIVRDQLDVLGPWRLITSTGENPLLREEAVDGRLWGLSPGERIQLVHATPRPVERPRPVEQPRVLRLPAATEAYLVAGIDLHGPSTESLTAELAWTEPVDDPAVGAPFRRSHTQIGFTAAIGPGEDTAVLHAIDTVITVAELGEIAVHDSRHVFADTRHREVTYRLRATTRYREYFPPAALAPEGDGDDGLSVVSAPFTLHVPSTAVPPPPVVHSVLPLFRWDRRSEPHHPAAWQHTRGSGVRVYLERPWNATGDGELLAVMLALGGHDGGKDGDPRYTQWGADPIWPSGGVARRMVQPVQLDHLLRISDLDARERPGRPVTDPVSLPTESRLTAQPPVTVLGYRPQYSVDRDMWYVDIAFDTDAAVWPFVRLSLARYQPHSLPGLELSEPVQADFVQLPPPRRTSVSRTDERHVKVLVSGPVAYRSDGAAGVPAPEPGSGSWMVGGEPFSTSPTLAGRLLVARLQERDPELGDDLGWRTVAVQELVPLGTSTWPPGLTYAAELDAGEDVDLRRPRDEPGDDAAGWRVTVEEWERFPGDPPPPWHPREASPPVWEQRLVFADAVHL